ncbi:MAG: bifunctional (p)ppGpp synthetase/guanosine-3',5'-bis(diphosphate) 3'-pyrophosphohydrolase [Myxococcales bacterium]|nr:bifunctional (p)ppGpp synthetase/guanosine-3',5'-bis(diphosphate) 3'-pyrophosphohydrolase [Myxococcales bacterium]
MEIGAEAAVTMERVLATVQAYAPGADTQLLTDAYLYAAFHHRGQMRKNGEDYLVHPINVAWILTELRMDIDTIAVGLLHDTVEDTQATVEDIRERFGNSVAEMVEGVTKLSKLAYRGKLEEQAENFRKLVLAFGKDIRVIIVKCADRLHNMRTLQYQRPDKRERIAQETLDIYAPLTHRLGLELMKRELEDLSFRYLHPDDYDQLAAAIQLDAKEREAYVAVTRALIQETLSARGMECRVTGRVKHIHSIWKKLRRTGKDLSELYDLLAFRVIVPERDACYVALGFMHAAFLPVATRMKDYIAMPKQNGYQSLHTTVVGPDGREVEIQFRTEAMDRVADTGIAAHWRYKNGRLSVSNGELAELARLRGFIDMARDIEDPADFLEAARSDLSATIHVFTPRKDVILLPEGSSALDFAYHVHTEVGNRAAGVKVNGRLVPFRTLVKTGDTVEVMTKTDAHPSRDWLDWAHSHRALEKIRKRLRESLADQAIALGREILDGALRRAGSSLKRVAGDKEAATRLDEAGFADLDELAEKVFAGGVSQTEAVRILAPPPDGPVPQPSALQALIQRVRKQSENAIVVSGETDILVDYARCCRPMKGEPILGYITRGRGLSVHKSACPSVKGLDAERFVQVSWDAQSKTLHQGLLHLVLEDRPGMLAAITGVCSTAKINLWKADVRQDEDHRAICDLGISVYDIGELDGLVKKLRGVRGVVAVERAAN